MPAPSTRKHDLPGPDGLENHSSNPQSSLSQRSVKNDPYRKDGIPARSEPHIVGLLLLCRHAAEDEKDMHGSRMEM